MAADAAAVLLGFDYGTLNIGVAVGDTVTGTARPLLTVKVSSGRPDWETIGALIETWRPAALVVGLPLDLDGGEQQMTSLARRFGRQLEGRYRLPVHAMDERLTSAEAKLIRREQGRGIEQIDPVAAQIILESWFREQTQ